MSPTLIHNKLYNWYEQYHRILPWRETDDPYKIWVSEVILQQTRVEQGMSYYLRFIERFPDATSLATASEEEVLRYWQGLGYYSRARNMHQAAKQIEQALQDTPYILQEGQYDFWRSLPGVGDYTAGAIASFAYNLPHMAIDGNVYRVLSRLFDCEIPFDTPAGKKHFKQLAQQLFDANNPRLYNSAIMELGAIQCVPNHPLCNECPLCSICQAKANGTVDMLPVRKARPKVRDRYFNYIIYCTPDQQTLIRQRQAKDIWQHLYEFPMEETEALLPPPHHTPYVDMKHQLSHQRIHARFSVQLVDQLPIIADTIPISLCRIDQYAIPQLIVKALRQLFGDAAIE